MLLPAPGLSCTLFMMKWSFVSGHIRSRGAEPLYNFNKKLVLPKDCDVRQIPLLPALRELEIRNQPASSRQPLPALLQQTCLTALFAQCHCSGTAGQLPASLRRLVLHGSFGKPPQPRAALADVAAALQGLPQQQHLALECQPFADGAVPPELAATIDALPALHSLHLGCIFDPQSQLTAMPPLNCLSRLRYVADSMGMSSSPTRS